MTIKTKISSLTAALAIGMISLGTLGGTADASGKSNSHIPLLGNTSQPIGHYNFCKKNRSECLVRSRKTSPLKLTRKRWSQLVSINSHSNSSVHPVTDQEYYKQEELWAYPGRYGDCEDYVLLKRKLLMDQGWPASSLLITIVLQPNGEGHAVLTARTDRADYILDNLNDKIEPWNNTRYRYLKLQSPKHTGKWVTANDDRGLKVGSIKR